MTEGTHDAEDHSHAGGGHQPVAPPPGPPAPFFDTKCILFIEFCRNYYNGANGQKVYVNNWYPCGVCLSFLKGLGTRPDREVK
jgi:hypothetical protein